MKYYAVKKGHKTGIYNTWDEAKIQVEGYKGAVYKSFSSLNEANDFLNDTLNLETCGVRAYVDGSYNVKTEEYSFGGVLLINNEEIQFKRKFDDIEYASMRNVAGEIKGAAFIIQYLINREIKEVTLYYDYTGIEKWYNKHWRANTEATKKYVEFSDYAKKHIKVNFVKVKSHSNDKYNDLADRLAKDALGIK